MTAVVYKCPACGCYLSDATEKDILVCPHCGTSITKVLSEEDKARKERKELFGIFHKDAQNGTKGLALMAIGCVIFGLIAHYLGI